MDIENNTLEELATAAKQGNAEAMPLLWQKTERLINMIIHEKICNRPLPNYIDESDIQQCGYFALLAAVNAYHPGEYKFTSYLNYSLQNAINECINGKSRRESKIKEVSYNQTVKDRSGDDVELLELLKDAEAEYEVYEPLELTDTRRIVIEALETLPALHRNIVYSHYFCNMTLKEIAGLHGYSISNIRQYEQQAFQILRKNPNLRALRDDLNANSFVKAFDYYKTSPEYWNNIKAAKEIERKILKASGKT